MCYQTFLIPCPKKTYQIDCLFPCKTARKAAHPPPMTAGAWYTALCSDPLYSVASAHEGRTCAHHKPKTSRLSPGHLRAFEMLFWGTRNLPSSSLGGPSQSKALVLCLFERTPSFTKRHEVKLCGDVRIQEEGDYLQAVCPMVKIHQTKSRGKWQVHYNPFLWWPMVCGSSGGLLRCISSEGWRVVFQQNEIFLPHILYDSVSLRRKDRFFLLFCILYFAPQVWPWKKGSSSKINYILAFLGKLTPPSKRANNSWCQLPLEWMNFLPKA